MHFDLRIEGKERIEQFICLLNLGILAALENDLLAIDEAMAYLYTPYSMSRLQETGVDQRIIDLIDAGTELADMESLIPEQLELEILSMQTRTLRRLRLYEGAVSPATSLDTWGHFLELRLEDRPNLERALLLLCLGVFKALEKKSDCAAEVLTYLFDAGIIDHLHDLRINPAVMTLLANGYAPALDRIPTLLRKIDRLLSDYLFVGFPPEKWIAVTPTYPCPADFRGDILRGDVIHAITWDTMRRTLIVFGTFVESDLSYQIIVEQMTQFHVQQRPLDHTDPACCSHKILVYPEPNEQVAGITFTPTLMFEMPDTVVSVRANSLTINGIRYELN